MSGPYSCPLCGQWVEKDDLIVDGTGHSDVTFYECPHCHEVTGNQSWFTDNDPELGEAEPEERQPEDDYSTPKTLVIQYDEQRWQPTEDEMKSMIGGIDAAMPDDVECIVLPEAIEFLNKEEARGVLSRLIERAMHGLEG